MVSFQQTAQTIRAGAHELAEAFDELLWPCRCAVCDAPSTLLCESCEMNLPYIDRWRACEKCGAFAGLETCTECNSFTLQQRGMEGLALDGCASVFRFEGGATRLVTVYKDRHEIRLAYTIARLLEANLDPCWLVGCALTNIPARKRALRKRGFDHMTVVTQRLSQLTGVPYAAVFAPWDNPDQRDTDAVGRMRNMRSALKIASGTAIPRKVIVVDDVLTTGATLYAAATTLKEAGAAKVYGLTLARV